MRRLKHKFGAMQTKPEKSICMVKHLDCMPNKVVMQNAQGLLHLHYLDMKRKYVHDTGASWCKFGEYEVIERLPEFGGDPLNQKATVGIKWEVKGRAFFIKRTFRGYEKNKT